MRAFPGTLVLTLIAFGGLPPATRAGDDGLPEFLAPLRAGVLAKQGKASFRHSVSDLGTPADAFDGRTGTVLRSRSVNPAFLEVTFDRPREVISAEAFFPGGAPHEWSLRAGDDPDDLRVLFRGRRVQPEAWSPVEKFGQPVRARIYRVEARRLAGDDYVHFGEIALQARQKPESVEVLVPSNVVCPRGGLPVRARVTWDGGYRSGNAHGLEIVTPPRSPLRLEPTGAADSYARAARFEQAGTASVRAVIPGSGVRVESPWTEIECRSDGKPDWSVTHIERTPRLPFDGPHGGFPETGNSVTWVAHVRNYGTVDAPRVPCAWSVDGRVVREGTLDALGRFQEGTTEIRLPWDGRRHEILFVFVTDAATPETSEANNARSVASDALLLGMWVERPVHDWFHRVQSSFGDGANGWEDWAQRQVARWNRLLGEARHPLTPLGVTDRIALDRIVVVEEGALPLGDGLPTNDPDARDRTVDLQWGLPATLLDDSWYRRVGERAEDNPLWLEGSLLHELSHARYLVDLYRLNVHLHEVALEAPGGGPLAGSPWLPVIRLDAVYYTGSGRMMVTDFSGGYGPHEACALQRVAGRRARGGNRNAPSVIGEYLAEIPRTVGIRVVGADGAPLDGVRVRAWRRGPAPGGGPEVFGGEPVREGTTADGGGLDLSTGSRDPFFEGRKEGAFDPGRAVLLLELSRGGKTEVRFLEVVPYNLAFWSGKTSSHYEDVRVDLPR